MVDNFLEEVFNYRGAGAVEGSDPITIEIQHKAGRALCSAWDDLSSFDEVVEGRAGDVQDLGNGGL